MRDSRAVVEWKGLKLDFSKSAAEGTRVQLVNLQANPGVRVNDSDSVTVAEAAAATTSARFIVVDLGHGRSWYPTRLFALAAAAQELHGAAVVIILAQRENMPGRFVGWLSPKDMVDAFCTSDTRYRLVLNHARAVLLHLRLSSGRDSYSAPTDYKNDLDAVRSAYRETSDLAFVPALIYRLQDAPPGPNSAPASPKQAPLEKADEPTWLGWTEVDQLFDAWMVREQASQGLTQAEQGAIMCRASRAGRKYLAITKENGAYVGMIDIDAEVRSAVLCGGAKQT